MPKNTEDNKIIPRGNAIVGEIYFSSMGCDETPEENEAFARAHFVNWGKSSSPKKEPLWLFRFFGAVYLIVFVLMLIYAIKG